jgi:molybdate transport system substrate-binding protein
MKKLFFVLFALLLSVSTASAKALTVSAAASLTHAFNDVKAAFEADNPGVTVYMNYASSGALYRQIVQGAPSDVYASANPKWMNKAEEDGFTVPGTRRNFTQNALVLITPADNPAGIASVNDLTKDNVTRVGVGTPETVPAGQYAKGSLEGMGLYEKLASKYVFGETVIQVLDYTRRGEVDAAFVYATDAIKGGDQIKIIQDMPLKKPVTYPVVILKTTTDQDLSQRFLDFLASPRGLSLLEARGFRKP